jgi:DNA mismatch repair protein MutH
MNKALSLNKLDEITAAAADILRLQSRASDVNSMTEDIMGDHGISDDEVNYRYRK